MEYKYTEIAEAIQNSPYSISAIGIRSVGVSELAQILQIIGKTDWGLILNKLKELHKYHPDTIEINKSQTERQHCYVGDVCNCYMPGIELKDYWCRKQKHKKIETTDKRNYKEYFEWRESVFIRDDYTCQDCDVRGGELNAHHIKSYKKFPKLRLKVENGQTLCEKCHRKIKKVK